MPLRILIVDDHSVVRKGLKAILQSRRGWKVCGEATEGRDAAEKADRLKPDVAIVDIGMPGLNGVDTTRLIRRRSPKTEVLILSAHESENLALDAYQAGARGYLTKDNADDDLLAAVHAVARHKPYFTRLVHDSIAREELRPERKRSRGVLTTREREVIQLLAEGKTNKEIAQTLHIAVKTAETHRANIMIKLDLHSLAELVHYAIRNEIVHSLRTRANGSGYLQIAPGKP
ncbi:MAG TPA: response regulator transcription factor [Candidatus Acidoferrales bacterium]